MPSSYYEMDVSGIIEVSLRDRFHLHGVPSVFPSECFQGVPRALMPVQPKAVLRTSSARLSGVLDSGMAISDRFGREIGRIARSWGKGQKSKD
jgi:hypothetical protein